ncbi:T9SS type A sorting domain-containing protein [Membranihabitans marinus]|uniref:T9SS type A sorting domain-containing protein n=1 Tax=Membranihabitans marinus TaxID=1227546 RepID=UPI001F38C2D3|nr:T9SS type A sorting domain-containing protein [Membranihabitans marinus]
MKNILVILMITLSSYFVQAESYPNLIVRSDKSFVLDINDWRMKDVEVSIIDNFGRIVHHDNISADYSKLKRYNLDQLEAGIYNVKIEDELKEVVYTVLVNRTNIALMTDKLVTYKPVVNVSDNKVDINILTLNKNVEVELYDVEGFSLYSEVKKNAPKYARRLDISDLPKGNYTVQIKFNDEMYNHSFYK